MKERNMHALDPYEAKVSNTFLEAEFSENFHITDKSQRNPALGIIKYEALAFLDARVCKVNPQG